MLCSNDHCLQFPDHPGFIDITDSQMKKRHLSHLLLQTNCPASKVFLMCSEKYLVISESRINSMKTQTLVVVPQVGPATGHIA